MKKTLLTFLLILPLAIFASCSDEKDMPVESTDATLTITFDNVAVVNGVIYTTQDYSMEIQSIAMKSSKGNTKGITEVEYDVDDTMSSRSLYAPFTGRIDTRDYQSGTHTLGILLDLLQNDNTQVPDNIQYIFTVVPTVEDIPGGAELGTFTQTVKLSEN